MSGGVGNSRWFERCVEFMFLHHAADFSGRAGNVLHFNFHDNHGLPLYF